MLPALVCLALLAGPAQPGQGAPSPPPPGEGPVILFLVDNSASLPPLDPEAERVAALEKMFGFLKGHRYRLILFGGKSEIFVDDVSRYRNDGQWTDFYHAFAKARELRQGYPPGPSSRWCSSPTRSSTPTPRTGPTCRRAGTRAATRCARRVELVREMRLPLYVMLIGDPAGEVAGRDREQSPGFVLDLVQAANGAAAAPLAQTVAAFFQDDGVLLRKFVYRVAPTEGLAKIEPVVKRIAAPPRAGIEFKIFGYFVLPLLLILVALLGLLVRSFPGPGDLEVVELAVDKPVHVATDKIHRAPDGTWSAQGLSLVEDPRTAAASFTLQAREPELTGAGLDTSGLDPRDAALLRADLDGVRRALEAATDSGTREDKIHALNLDYAARGLDSREAERLLLSSPAERARIPALDFVRAKTHLAFDEGLRQRLVEPRVQLVTLRQGRHAPGARPGRRRCGSAATASWCASSARGGRKDHAARALLRPRALAARPEDDPARRVPAGVPLPPQPPAGGELEARWSGRILTAGIDARELRLEVRFLQREPDLVQEALSARELFDDAARKDGAQLVVLGPRLPDVPLVETIQRIREGHASRRVSILVMIPASEPPGTEGVVLGAGANAALRRPLDRFVLESWVSKLVDVPNRVLARIPVHVQVVGSRHGAPGEHFYGLSRNLSVHGMLLASPVRIEAAGPRPGDRPAGGRGARARARARRARGARGRLALRRLRDRVPVPARGRAARDRPPGAARGAARAAAQPVGARVRSTRRCAGTTGSTRSPTRPAPRAASWSRSGAARARAGARAARARSTWSRSRSPEAALEAARDFVQRHG